MWAWGIILHWAFWGNPRPTFITWTPFVHETCTDSRGCPLSCGHAPRLLPTSKSIKTAIANWQIGPLVLAAKDVATSNTVCTIFFF